MGTAAGDAAEQQQEAAKNQNQQHPPAPAPAPAPPPPAVKQQRTTTLVFTYGTLKRGFSNHPLLQELSDSGDASFVGPAVTSSRLPLVCGPYRVPFLLHLPGEGEHRVAGELYAVTRRGLARLDELEGVATGHYEPLPLAVDLLLLGGGGGGVGGHHQSAAPVDAIAYFAHRSYAGDLWRRSGEEGVPEYTHGVAAGYVRRKDRPQGQTFLEQIRLFVAAQS